MDAQLINIWHIVSKLALASVIFSQSLGLEKVE